MQLIHIEPQTSGEAGGITSSLRCENAAWRKPEEDEASFILETRCLLSTALQQHGYWVSPHHRRQRYNSV